MDTSCKNCQQPVGLNFCPECGQQALLPPNTLKTLRQQVSDALSIEHSITLKTLKAMVLRPGSFIDNYLNGHRVGYQTPINYLMIAFALLVFLMTFYINDLTVNFVEASAIAEVNDKVKQLAQKASEIVATQANFFLFFMPLCLGFVMSKGEKRPSGDFYFASSFIVATSIFILSPLYVALIWFPSIVKIKLALNLMYLCFAFYQFIKPSGLMHTVGLFIKVVLGWGLYMLLVMTFVLVQLLISPLLS